ncbi:MAG: homoserine kinase [Microcoleaceae cyanobacterium]
MLRSVTVTVPATTANLGPGFDCLGAALTLHNTLTFSVMEPGAEAQTLRIVVRGLEADRVVTTEQNLAYQAFVRLYQHLGQSPPPLDLELDLGVPLARGLGSSATAIIGGLVGANTLTGNPLGSAELIKLAIDLEGHPDNVVPALLGNCQLCVSSDSNLSSSSPWEICEIPWHESIIPIVAIPDFELSTAEARRVLPVTYSKADAIFNTAHLGLLVRGLEAGKENWLQIAMQDRIHQPYRQVLIRGYETVCQRALQAGAYGVVISGAGPTLLALTHAESATAVALAMAEAWNHEAVKVEVRSLQIDTQGTRVLQHSSNS